MPCGCRATSDSHGRAICGHKGLYIGVPAPPGQPGSRWKSSSFAGGCEVCSGSGVLRGRPEKKLQAKRPLEYLTHIWLDLPSGREVDKSWANYEGRDADIRCRFEAGESQERIAKLYEMSQGNVSRILNGNHQRPLGRYGDGVHVKRPTDAELDVIAEDLCELLEARADLIDEERGLWKPWRVARALVMHTCPY
jgi:hypothetical protein